VANQYAQLVQEIKNKIYHPVYFFSGEEAFYIDQLSDLIEDTVLNEIEREFDLSIVYGREVSVNEIIMAAKSFPMMAPQKVLIVKEAQAVEKIEELDKYLNKPSRSTLLVICYKYKKIDGRTAFAKNLSKKAVFFESPKLYENQIPAWINEWCSLKGYRISNKSCIMLSEFLGNDLSRISNELNKLFINIDKSKEITPDLIEYYIGISKDYNAFELQKTLGRKDIAGTYKILAYFISNSKNNPLVKVIPLIFPFFQKLLIYKQIPPSTDNKTVASALGVNPFFLQDYQVASKNYDINKLIQIISILREYDIKSKGVDSNPVGDGELMKEMFYKITH